MNESSGDILADRRYAYAEAAFGEGDFAASADLARQALELAPDFAAASFLLGRAAAAMYEAAGRAPASLPLYHEATRAFEDTLASDPQDRLGARLRLAALSVGDPLAAMSPGYVQALFDEYATRFDRHLTQSLGYRGPALLHDAVRRACSLRLRDFAFEAALDLGCGTGLAGAAFRPHCRRLAGIDLSPAMVAKAAGKVSAGKKATDKRLYDELATGDLVDWLEARAPTSADLVLAADVLVYLGDLRPLFAAVARVLRPDGLFAFTVQALDEGEVALGADLRFAHSERHLTALTAESGLVTALAEPCVTREDRGIPVRGALAVLARPRFAATERRAPPG